MIVNKRVNLNLFAIMEAFQRQARKEGWTKEEIDSVLNEARSGDYNHLIVTIMDHCDMGDNDGNK